MIEGKRYKLKDLETYFSKEALESLEEYFDETSVFFKHGNGMIVDPVVEIYLKVNGRCYPRSFSLKTIGDMINPDEYLDEVLLGVERVEELQRGIDVTLREF